MTLMSSVEVAVFVWLASIIFGMLVGLCIREMGQ
jgi:hypothetical protein